MLYRPGQNDNRPSNFAYYVTDDVFDPVRGAIRIEIIPVNDEPLAGDDGLSRVFLPFDKAAGVEIRLGEHEAEIEAAATGAQG